MNKLIYAAVLILAFGAASGAPAKRSKIEVVYQSQSNGDYRLFLFGSDRTLVCEEKPLKIVQDGDAVNPVVIECRH
jgi:hypothetical protein